MRASISPLTERLADIGGHLQKLRWEALDTGFPDTARDIAHAIDAVAWAAGIYNAGANVVDRPGDPPLNGQFQISPSLPMQAEQRTPPNQYYRPCCLYRRSVFHKRSLITGSCGSSSWALCKSARVFSLSPFR